MIIMVVGYHTLPSDHRSFVEYSLHTQIDIQANITQLNIYSVYGRPSTQSLHPKTIKLTQKMKSLSGKLYFLQRWLGLEGELWLVTCVIFVQVGFFGNISFWIWCPFSLLHSFDVFRMKCVLYLERDCHVKVGQIFSLFVVFESNWITDCFVLLMGKRGMFLFLSFHVLKKI